jgi:hypothetical protein
MLLLITVENGHILRTSSYSFEYLATTIRYFNFIAFFILYLQKCYTNLHGNDPARILGMNFEYLEVR